MDSRESAADRCIRAKPGDVSGASSGALLGTLSLALLLMLCAVWIYWPGINGPELLDDSSNVLVLDDVKLQPELAFDYIFGNTSGIFGRSVSMASFVLEKVYLDADTVSSKQINIVLHALNGGLLIWLFWLLFRYRQVPGYRVLAVLSGALWLLHPLLVSTVLYVVQRMTMLATFFMLLASISYVYWRLGAIAGVASVWRFLPVPALLAIALLAKENAVVLVPILLSMEALWFRFAGREGRVIKWLQRASYGLIISGASVLLALLVFGWERLAARFATRRFSLEERLLTEARIVWDYILQWFYPHLARMGLYHDDVVVSHSLLEPVASLYALLAWLLLAVFCGALLRWQGGRCIVFGIAWFVLGHGVESTVLPLELYFEHRNYFPSMGLALAVACVLSIVIKKWPEAKAPLLVCLGFSVVVVSAQTSSQAQIWSSRSLLALNHLNGHPDSARANIDMATELAALGAIEASYQYSKRAFAASANQAAVQERSGDYQIRNMALSCIAHKPVPPTQIDELGGAEPDRPLQSDTTLLTMVRLLQDNRCPQFDRLRFADRLAELFLAENSQASASAKIYSSLAVLENALQRYDNAFIYAERLLALSPNNKHGLLMKLHFSSALHETEITREVISTLQQMDQQGKLNVREQQTLSLYVEK